MHEDHGDHRHDNVSTDSKKYIMYLFITNVVCLTSEFEKKENKRKNEQTAQLLIVNERLNVSAVNFMNERRQNKK